MTKIESRTLEMRKLFSLAVQAGRKRQSEETGFIHHCYKGKFSSLDHTIPFLENVLFVLALLRTRTSENVQEGLGILEHILHFQNKEEGLSKGNFPVYLHEYPFCSQRWQAVRMLSVLYWIYREYRHILGEKLKNNLKDALFFLLDYCCEQSKDKSIPYHLSVLIFSVRKAVKNLFCIPYEEEDLVLRNLSEHFDISSFSSPRFLSDILVGLQMLYENFSGTIWENFERSFVVFWQENFLAYAGPPIKEHQFKSSPETTYYDFLFSYLSNKLGKRILEDNISQLQAALIRPLKIKLLSSEVGGSFQGAFLGNKWSFIQKKDSSFSVIQNSGNISPDLGFHVFRLIWGSPDRIYTLACPKGNYSLDYTVCSDGVDLIFTLSNSLDFENSRRCREIVFYVSPCEEVGLLVGGRSATTFQVGEKLELKNSHLDLSMLFKVEFGKGRFFGHFVRGNRPSQLYLKRDKKFFSFDSLVILRTVYREESCGVRAKIRFS